MPLKDFLKSASEKTKAKASELTDKLVKSEFGQKINAAELVDKTKDKAAKTSAKVKEFASTAKKQAYKSAGKFERQYYGKQGIGGGIRKTISRGRVLCKALKLATKPLGAEKVSAKTRKYYERLHAYNSSFIETFTTEGKYDPDKLGDALKHEAAIAEVYGKKAAKWLFDLSKKSGSAVHQDFRGYIPTLDELTDKYAGIGIKCEGLILRPDLEACLNFHNKAFKNLPREDLTLSILQDIKSNAIKNKDELLKFYMPDGDSGENKDKVKTVIDYL